MNLRIDKKFGKPFFNLEKYSGCGIGGMGERRRLRLGFYPDFDYALARIKYRIKCASLVGNTKKVKKLFTDLELLNEAKNTFTQEYINKRLQDAVKRFNLKSL